MLEKEILLDTLREEYPEEVANIINTCHFSGKSYLDVDSLNSRLRGLRLIGHPTVALTEDDWFELAYEFAPEVYDDLTYGKLVA